MKEQTKHKAPRPVPGVSREAEEEQLKIIINIAQDNLTKTEKEVAKLSGELHELMESYGPKDKEALSMLRNTQVQFTQSRRDLIRRQKARKKPYFGRIDFKDSGRTCEESYYVGRSGISLDPSEPIVIDWRAPVASIYYENTSGRCSYRVKNEGVYEVDLHRKRTYEIENDQLLDFYDSDVVANDALLTKYLAKNKTAVLGEIIATIQQEQNAIIRRPPKLNLIVQGVAGSGKTTVAMHRISYILYNYEEDFRPQDFYIIGSNEILLNYITSALPDLDVYGVTQMTMEQLFVRLLYEDWDPIACAVSPVDEAAALKGSSQWFYELQDFCNAYEQAAIPKTEVRLEKTGVLLMDPAAIDRCIAERRGLSMQEKINMLNAILMSKLENELAGKYVTYPDQERKALVRQYRWHFGRNVWKGSIFQVYEEFLEAQAAVGKTVPYTKNVYDLYDLAALAYIYKRIKETDGIREASHVIIDEAQDFGMMAYDVLKYCLSDCSYTIMGDVSQNIHYGFGLNDWEELKALMLPSDGSGFCTLKKSYRNTVEISNFATQILRHGNFPIYPVEPVIRHGSPVTTLRCSSSEEMLFETEKIIRQWQEEGRETIAVVCRDNEQAAQVTACLGKKMTLADSDPKTATFTQGVMVLSVEYTKGLEFDGVVLYDPSAAHYPAEDASVKLLYVAATRALHQLAVIHQGDLTDLIAKPANDKKPVTFLEKQDPLPKKAPKLPKTAAGTPPAAEPLPATPAAPAAAPAPAAVPDSSASAAVPSADGGSDQATGKLQAAGSDSSAGGKLSGALKPSAGVANVQAAGSAGAANAQAAGIAGAPNAQAAGMVNASAPGTAPRRVIKDTSKRPVNPSPYEFGACPPGNAISRGKYSADTGAGPKAAALSHQAISKIKKTKKSLYLGSALGTLRITPVDAKIFRIQFKQGDTMPFKSSFWDYEPETPVSWTARAGKSLIQAETQDLAVRIDKKTGALQFFNKEGKLLLREDPGMPRRISDRPFPETWNYFDWDKNEKIYAKGILPDDLERMNNKARYISFGGMKMRLPLVVSDKNYGLAVAGERTVMCCGISMYGTYVYTDGMDQIDYYFIYGKDYKEILELYKQLG